MLDPDSVAIKLDQIPEKDRARVKSVIFFSTKKFCEVQGSPVTKEDFLSILQSRKPTVTQDNLKRYTTWGEKSKR